MDDSREPFSSVGAGEKEREEKGREEPVSEDVTAELGSTKLLGEVTENKKRDAGQRRKSEKMSEIHAREERKGLANAPPGRVRVCLVSLLEVS